MGTASFDFGWLINRDGVTEQLETRRSVLWSLIRRE